MNKTYIDLAAIQYNCSYIRSKSPSSKLLAVVKGDAYGHGIEKVCNAILPDVNGFGVACIDEALKIRKLGINKPILLIKGIVTYEELRLVAEFNLQIVVHSFYQLELLKKFPLKSSIGVWLKIDTGIHRLGFQPDLFIDVYKTLVEIKNVIKPIVIMTHISNASNESDIKTQAQVKKFLQITSGLDGEKSVANSNAIFSQMNLGFDWMRIGGALYGVSTMQGKVGTELGLRPAMVLISRLIAIQKFKKDDDIGYGGAWVCPEDMPIGIVDIGYADGYPRNINVNTPVLINNIRCYIIGRVSMNMLFVDLRICPGAKIGDVVILWGESLAVEEIAEHANTFCLELLCRLKCKSYAKHSL